MARLFRRDAIDVLCGGPPCPLWFRGSQFARSGGTELPTDDSAYVLEPLVEAGIQGGVTAMAFENAPTFLLPGNSFWHGPDGLRSRLLHAGYCVETAAEVDSSRLPWAVAQRRIRCLIVAVRGVDSIGLRAALCRAMVREDRARCVSDEFPGCARFYSHPFHLHSRSIHEATSPSPALRCNCCEPVGFVRGSRESAESLPPDVRVFSAEDCARLQGFEENYAWPALHVRCPCEHCRPKRPSGYHHRARGRQIGNAVTSSYGRFVASLLGPLLSTPRAELRAARLGGW